MYSDGILGIKVSHFRRECTVRRNIGKEEGLHL